MTDKQIIFKCDVDCIRKNTEECFELDCIKGQESILKQLKAKEQECDELTSKCSQLKEEIKDWQKEVERIQFIGSYGIMDEVKKNTKLKQTLTKIKEIAENAYCLTNGTNKDTAQFAKQILQKISEVEDENI